MNILGRQRVLELRKPWHSDHISPRRLRNICISAALLLVVSALWLSRDLAIESFHAVATKQQTTIEISSISRSLIPPQIWQIMLPKPGSSGLIEPENLQDAASWLALNPDFKYTLVGAEGAQALMRENTLYQTQSKGIFEELQNEGMKSDLLRYSLLYTHGGVYTDADTVAIKSIREWIPAHLRDQVRLVVGIEFDRRDGGHPVFETMVARVLSSVAELTNGTDGQKAVADLHPSSFEVMNSTGPVAWTDVVFEHLQGFDPSLNATKDLAFLEEPTLFGDILVLTIDGFGMGQPHSHSTNDGSIPSAALMRHLFRGSWRGD